MANFITNSTINTTITLTDISETAYNKIVDYIRSVVDRENGKKPERKTALKPVQTVVEDPAPAPVANKDPESFAPVDKYANVAHYRGWEKVVEICMEADNHPEDYVEEWVTPTEWMDCYPVFDGVPLHGVAHTLSSMANLHIIKRKSNLKEGNVKAQTVWFYLPIPQDEADKPITQERMPVEDPKELEETVCNISPEAKALKKNRMDRGYSLKEFSDMIGYAPDIVLGWECGTKTMSVDARNVIKMVLGPNALTGAAS